VTTAPSRKLALDDIADLRAYERERVDFRAHIIGLKRRRRVAVGPFVTFVFENRDTVRFQIQEMARAERILTDAGIQAELDVYNPLIPEPGSLSATMFIELTSEPELRAWLPKLVGIERSPRLVLADGGEVPAAPDPAHEAQLTREDLTASVHYVHFDLGPAAVAAASSGPIVLAVEHPAYRHRVTLAPDTLAELRSDLTA